MWLTNIIGLLLISGIVYWFWLYKPADFSKASDGVVQILVENGVYQPARVEIPVNKKTTLRFIRKDASPCAATLLLSDFNISEELPVGKPKDILLTPKRTGSFDFTCQMQMYKGELLVVNE